MEPSLTLKLTQLCMFDFKQTKSLETFRCPTNLLCGFDPFGWSEDHHETVDEDSGDDDEGEEGVN